MQSTYTGVYAKGGPTNVDMDPGSLASVCDRSPADARGVKVGGGGGGGGSAGGSGPNSRRATAERAAAVGRRVTAERRIAGAF